MSDIKHKNAIKKFIEFWTNRGYEKGESQKFWLQLLRDILNIENPEEFISFEDKVLMDHTSFIDGYISSTKVLIEQKSIDKDLNKAIKQSDGSYLTPFLQAKRYSAELPYSKRPRWVITCNFKEFYIYDMEKPQSEPEIIKLQDLEKEHYRLSFLVSEEDIHLKKEMEVSIEAGKLVGLIYDALLKQYIDKNSEETLKSLNKLCVRLVFCLYAEDAEIFDKHDAFYDYLKQFDSKHIRKALIDLFKILDTKIEDRDPYLDDDLKAFPYVNGGLFADEDIEIPNFTDEIKELLLIKASKGFNWSKISPTIFGAVFESTLNPETRRKGGMHYTSIENIHKVIDPLFLDDLKDEFREIKKISTGKAKQNKLKQFQEKISNLNFLDPACGSGNFLTETYISLRKLENEVLETLYSKEGVLQGKLGFEGEHNPIKVSIGQFYGIEINDFAVTVAKTALWIAESQMMKKTEDIIHQDLNFLPLKTYANIVEANALRIDWQDVIPKEKLNYIMGNPPFVGNNNMDKAQREDLLPFFPANKTMDYVCCWYKKSVEMMSANKNIKAALVSTNSITQGEQVYLLWNDIINKYNINIDFAYKTFPWSSEAKLKAQVYCVIIGFSYQNNKPKVIYNDKHSTIVNNISPYLINSENIMVKSSSKPLCKVPEIRKGNQPTDGGNLIIEESEYSDFIEKEPKAKKYIKKLVGAKEYINNSNRYCLWLKDCPPNELRQMPHVLKRVEKVKLMRLQSPDESTKKLAEKPTLFREMNNYNSFIIIPSSSSSNRKYIPLGFLDKDTIPTNSVLIIPNASLYHFGILTSNVHMAWVRVVCGRLKSDYRYSKDIVYNNFPWCNPTDEQKVKIEKTAQGILDARSLYPDCSLADLYDELTMPAELRKAHQENDKAVMEAYNFKKKDENGKVQWLSESETVAELMKMYQKILNK